MDVDLHIHTFPASQCSRIGVGEYVAQCTALGVEAIALTNHGSVTDSEAIAGALGDLGIVLIHGVEISTLFGDFVIYSPDLEYLASFRSTQDAPRPGTIADHAALVWVHPGAGGGQSGSAYYLGLENHVVPVIDAVEVYNGNWLDQRFVSTAQRIADVAGLPCTGGSDAHDVADMMACFTEIPGRVTSTADVVAAIKNGLVTPRLRARKRRRFGLF